MQDFERPDMHTMLWISTPLVFDPVLRERDGPNWMDADAPDSIIAKMNLRERMLESAHGPFRRFAIKRLLGDLDARGIIRMLQARYRPPDVLVQQKKVANAEALAFIAPVYFVGFPAILKGWIERVFTPGFAFGLSPEGGAAMSPAGGRC